MRSTTGPGVADVVIVGAGIVGLATANAVQLRYPGRSVLVLEKEARPGMHQTGHNSGVIHSGIYYKPGSFKAEFCKAGNAALQRFCVENEIPFEICGKVIVATDQGELPQLEKLWERGVANGLEVRRLSAAELREIEPHVAGVAGLHVPSTGIVDYKAVVARLADLVASRGGEIRCGTRVLAVKGQVAETTSGAIEMNTLVNCAGLHSDRLARASGVSLGARIVPFRGEYYQLRPERASLVRGLIYPVPNPSFPFLGVHCTRMMDGSIHLGPNAVLALSREGYHKSTISVRDTIETLSFPGFWKLAARHWREGAHEMIRSFSRAAFVRSLQRLVPEITDEDVIPSEAGVRAQALRPDGTLEDDFLIMKQGRTIHVCNAPSPAATASLKIGETVAAAIAGG
jgi:(S)-2-hydroxyglutarate dehydrogenase